MNPRQVSVLLIEKDSADARFTATTLANAKRASFKVEMCERMDSALERISKGGIDILLLDLNLPDSQGFETFRHARSAAVGMPIVVMSGLDDENMAMQAVEMGAQDYLIKGRLSGDSLARTVVFAIERQRKQTADRHRHEGKIIAFVGSKGGVGTTTVALNVASAIAQANKSAIAVELNGNFGTFSSQLGHVPESNLSDLLRLSSDKLSESEIDSRLVKFPWGLRVLFGPQLIEDFQQIEKKRAELLCDRLVHMADYVVVDLPDGWLAGSQVIAKRCHFGAVVLDNDPLSLTCAKVVIKQLAAAGASRPLLQAILVNRSETAVGLRISDITAVLECEVFGVISPATGLCQRAQEASTPFVLVAPQATPSAAVHDMVQKLLRQDSIAERAYRARTE